ncbi:FkbM family methyltransferase [Flavobacterium paronense]
MIRKLQFYRLNLKNTIKIFYFLFCRFFKRNITDEQNQLYNFYFHLIRYNGYLKKEDKDYFTSFYPTLDITIRVRKRTSSDLRIFELIFYYQEYKEVVATFKKYFSNDNALNIIDAGSNIGLASVYFSKHFQNSSLIAIEPDTANFNNLVFNLDNNGLQNSFKIKGGLWSSNTNLKIIADFRDKQDWSFRVEETVEESDVKAYSVQYLMKQYNFDTIDIFKIDIEGSEKEIFTNPKSDTSFLSITKCIVIEIHDEFDCREDIYKVLTNYNFEFHQHGELTVGINKNLKELF